LVASLFQAVVRNLLKPQLPYALRMRGTCSRGHDEDLKNIKEPKD